MVPTVCCSSERIPPQDALWGLVLLGLLMAQAFGQQGFSHPVHPLDHHHAELSAQFIVQLLVSGQFERLGSFLFGLSFYRCWQHGGPSSPGLEGPNLTGSGITRPGTHRLARRLLIELLGIGLGLSLLPGSAVLLLQYALLGFTLFYFIHLSVFRLSIWILSLALLTVLVTSSLGLLTSALAPDQAPVHFIQTSVQPGLLGEAGLSLWHWLLPGHSVSQGFSAFLSYELMLLGGLLVGKLGLLSGDHRLRVRLSLFQIGVLPAAFLVKGAWVALSLGLVKHPASVVTYQPVLLALTGFLGPLLLSGGYLLEVGLNGRSDFPGWTNWPARIGQMGLSNYVLQSLLCPLLLYGYGLAVSSQPTSLGRAGIVVGIYGFQMGFSYLWGKRFGQGPLEWACRHWVYSKSDLQI